MKPEIKEKWAAALESGKYTQGSGCLRRDDGSYCCLGVLTELYLKEHNASWDPLTYTEAQKHKNDPFKDRICGWMADLQPDVMRWAGLAEGESDPTLGDHSASHLNDVKKLDFKRIAELIREYL